MLGLLSKSASISERSTIPEHMQHVLHLYRSSAPHQDPGWHHMFRSHRLTVKLMKTKFRNFYHTCKWQSKYSNSATSSTMQGTCEDNNSNFLL